jgi:hypothetical protein
VQTSIFDSTSPVQQSANAAPHAVSVALDPDEKRSASHLDRASVGVNPSWLD